MKGAWKDFESHTLRRTRVKQCLLDMTGKLQSLVNPQQLWLPAEDLYKINSVNFCHEVLAQPPHP